LIFSRAWIPPALTWRPAPWRVDDGLGGLGRARRAPGRPSSRLVTWTGARVAWSRYGTSLCAGRGQGTVGMLPPLTSQVAPVDVGGASGGEHGDHVGDLRRAGRCGARGRFRSLISPRDRLVARQARRSGRGGSAMPPGRSQMPVCTGAGRDAAGRGPAGRPPWRGPSCSRPGRPWRRRSRPGTGPGWRARSEVTAMITPRARAPHGGQQVGDGAAGGGEVDRHGGLPGGVVQLVHVPPPAHPGARDEDVGGPRRRPPGPRSSPGPTPRGRGQVGGNGHGRARRRARGRRARRFSARRVLVDVDEDEAGRPRRTWPGAVGAADAAGRAGDDDGGAVEAEVH